MDPLAYLVLGLAPGLFCFWIFVRVLRRRPDPRALVIRTFLLGILAALPLVVIEHVVGDDTGTRELSELLFTGFVLVGIIEELFKYLVVRLSLGSSPYLDEPRRGLVYGAAVALGFTTIQNITPLFASTNEVFAQQALLRTLAHVSWAAMWGYGLGADSLAGADGRSPRGFAILGLVGAIIAHVAYDVGVLAARDDIIFLAFAGSLALGVVLLVRANARSIHRGRSCARQIRCAACTALSPLGKRFCSECGASLPHQAPIHCGACHKVIDLRAAYCVHCGVGVVVARGPAAVRTSAGAAISARLTDSSHLPKMNSSSSRICAHEFPYVRRLALHLHALAGAPRCGLWRR